MRTDLVKKFGWRDDNTDSRSEEWRICGEIQREGYKTGYARDIRCYHFFGDGNWGYDEKTPHGHAYTQYASIKDGEFDWNTCIPKQEQAGLLERFEDRNF
jgi:hypothetical protein